MEGWLFVERLTPCSVGRTGPRQVSQISTAALQPPTHHRPAPRPLQPWSARRVVDATAPCITLEPHPNREVHPLAYQRLLRRAQRLAAAAAAGEMDEAGGESEEEEEDDGESVHFIEAFDAG